jgi:hypothetical protein
LFTFESHFFENKAFKIQSAIQFDVYFLGLLKLLVDLVLKNVLGNVSPSTFILLSFTKAPLANYREDVALPKGVINFYCY